MSDKDNLPPPPSASQMKALRHFTIVMCVLMTISGILGVMNGVYRRYNPELPYDIAKRVADNPAAVVRNMTVNGVRLHIPVPYFKTFAPPSGVHGQVYLVAMYPEFSFITEDYGDLFDTGEWRQRVTLMVHSPTGRIPLSQIKENRRKQAKAEDVVGNIYGLDRYKINTDGSGEIFAIPGSKNDAEFITCGFASNPHALCEMWFEHAGFQVDVGFFRDLLEHWDDIKAKSIVLIDSFIINGDRDIQKQ